MPQPCVADGDEQASSVSTCFEHPAFHTPLKKISVAVRVRIRVSGGCPRPAPAPPGAPNEEPPPPLLLGRPMLRKLPGPGLLDDDGWSALPSVGICTRMPCLLGMDGFGIIRIQG